MNNLVALLTSFDGRIGRGKFWFGIMVILVTTIAIGAALIGLGLGTTTIETGTIQVNGGTATPFARTAWTLAPWPSFILSVVMSLPAAAIGVKRRKDRDFSGVDVLGFLLASLLLQLLATLGVGGQLLAVLNIALFVWSLCLLVLLGFLKGTGGPNKYGPDPLGVPLSAATVVQR